MQNTYECDFCHKRYKSKTYLKTHIEYKHLNTEAAQIKAIVSSLRRVINHNKNAYSCEMCLKHFSSKNGLSYHEKRAHRTSLQQFNCIICHKNFAYNQDLHLHIKNYHCYKDCEVCGAKITVNRYKSHLKVHNNQREHRCLMCSKTFTRRDLLNKHLFSHSERKPFNCGQCVRGFYDRSRLKKHEMKFHS